jgi:hypothetical protein
MLDAILNARVTFEATLWVATLAAFVLLLLVIGNLHLRLVRLERIPAGRPVAAYGHLLGRHATEFLGAEAGFLGPEAGRPRALLLLSSGCPACQRLIRELDQLATLPAIALAWTRGEMPDLKALPPGVTVLDDGAAVARRVGASVTPFLLRFNSEGFVEEAGPITALDGLRQAVQTAEPLQLAHKLAAR